MTMTTPTVPNNTGNNDQTAIETPDTNITIMNTRTSSSPSSDFNDDRVHLLVDLENGGRNNSSRRRSLKPHQEEVVIETSFFATTLRGKYQIRAATQTLFFGALLIGYGLFHIHSSISSSSEDNDLQVSRFLQQAEVTDAPTTLCSSLPMADSWWMTVFYVIGILYMFLALAIVCDEFFVPALEELSGPRRMNLSMDVAGATLMAAGGSAPELATSIIGTFRQSEIGFGTIVGSAVFNVLFVIGMCSLLAKETLTLTWWPLFRDTSYYTVGLVMLAVFTGFVTPNRIELWEACVLFIMYIGYILLMWQNKNLYKALTGKVLEYPEENDGEDDDDDVAAATAASGSGGDGDGNGEGDDDDDDDVDGDNHNNKKEEMPTDDTSTSSQNGTTSSQNGMLRPGLMRELSKSSINSHLSQLSAKYSEPSSASHPHFRWQGTFRAGILKLLKDGDSWMDAAGAGIVAKIVGDADYVFEQVDRDGNGHIDREELRQLFDLLECYASTEELEEVFIQLDTNGDGVISRKEFAEWYCRAEERIMSQIRHVFDQIDVDKSNTLDKEELKTLLATLDPHVSDEDVQSALDAMYKHGSPNEITFEEFSEWYKSSMIYERHKQLIEEDIEGVWDNVCPPKEGGIRDWAWYIICLPLVFVLTFTIPDVQRPGMGKWCYVSFILSIAWIGGFSYLMVDWAEVVGNTIGVPSDIMGLTILAAGTSVPDLLSSVIVARRGQGDMAVSSSVGSNIFDILVGLPIPWILYSAVNGGISVYIGSDGLVRSLIILIVMLVLVIASVHCQGWKLTKVLGGIMFFFYVAFLIQAVVLELPFDICVKT